MITPEDNSAFENEEQDEQYSQQDVQSDGFDEQPPSEEDKEAAELENLKQADKASESSFTLNVDNGIAPKQTDKN